MEKEISASSKHLYKVNLANHKRKTEINVFVASNTIECAISIMKSHHSFDGCVINGINKESDVLFDGNYNN